MFINPATLVTLIFNRYGNPRWSVTEAREWAKEHGYVWKNSAIEITPKKIRILQRDSSEFDRFRTVRFGQGIQALMGWTEEEWTGEGPPKKTRKQQLRAARRKRVSKRPPSAWQRFLAEELPELRASGLTHREAMAEASRLWKRQRER